LLQLPGAAQFTSPPQPAAAIAATQGTSLIDLSDKIGALGCKVPSSVDLGAVMGRLTGTLKNFK